MAGCLYGSRYQTKTGKKDKAAPLVKDAAGNPILLIKCGKLCDPGEKYCPKHKLMDQIEQEKRGA